MYEYILENRPMLLGGKCGKSNKKKRKTWKEKVERERLNEYEVKNINMDKKGQKIKKKKENKKYILPTGGKSIIFWKEGKD